MRCVLRSKIHRAPVTEADVSYVGSISIDEDLLDRAGLRVHEKVLVVSLTSGARLETSDPGAEPIRHDRHERSGRASDPGGRENHHHGIRAGRPAVPADRDPRGRRESFPSISLARLKRAFLRCHIRRSFGSRANGGRRTPGRAAKASIPALARRSGNSPRRARPTPRRPSTRRGAYSTRAPGRTSRARARGAARARRAGSRRRGPSSGAIWLARTASSSATACTRSRAPSPSAGTTPVSRATFSAESAELDSGQRVMLAREPVGVVGIIVPWNAPITLLVRSLAPVIAAGCTAVVKAAPQTALVNERVFKLLAAIEALAGTAP